MVTNPRTTMSCVKTYCNGILFHVISSNPHIKIKMYLHEHICKVTGGVNEEVLMGLWGYSRQKRLRTAASLPVLIG